MKILVTGAAGFIGYHVSKTLCERGDEVVGIDNLNDYYDVSLKEARLEQLKPYDNFHFFKMDIADRPTIENLFKEKGFNKVVHLAAQAGVRYSIENPHAYADSNLVGYLNILEGCRHNKIEHLVYASSSSVYGANKKIPFSESDNVDRPVSLYAATKKANELMAHSYSHLYDLPTTGLRFFTVYGPWGRPDMSPMLFAKAITEGKPIKIFNYGKHKRDFTYIDDIVEGVTRCLDSNSVDSYAAWNIFNIGNNQPVKLLYYIELLEKSFGQETEKQLLPLQPGDVEETFADIDALNNSVGYMPRVSIEKGIKLFSDWYKNFYKNA